MALHVGAQIGLFSQSNMFFYYVTQWFSLRELTTPLSTKRRQTFLDIYQTPCRQCTNELIKPIIPEVLSEFYVMVTSVCNWPI